MSLFLQFFEPIDNAIKYLVHHCYAPFFFLLAIKKKFEFYYVVCKKCIAGTFAKLVCGGLGAGSTSRI